MRWYLNDASIQAQFANPSDFLDVLRQLIALRQQFDVLRTTLFVTRSLSTRNLRTGLSLVELLRQPEHHALRGMVLRWLDRAGPFVDDDRWPEIDDYFEFEGLDVTDTGLGEATRRVKAGEHAATFSFCGGPIDFTGALLTVFHGIPDERIGRYSVSNLCTFDAFRTGVSEAIPPPRNWLALIETARSRFPKLWLPDAIHQNDALAREAFDSIICDRTLVLLDILNCYMDARNPDGSESAQAQQIIQTHFAGDRAAFSGESPTNQRQFKQQLTFQDPATPTVSLFAHWHGKISHRVFRLHFMWPVPPGLDRLKVVYLGPKITKG